MPRADFTFWLPQTIGQRGTENNGLVREGKKSKIVTGNTRVLKRATQQATGDTLDCHATL